MSTNRPYVGRFAPSPTGRLHLGSMVAAVASWLDAKAHGGVWLVRIEDLDPPREVKGAADDILKTLEGFGLEWDGQVVYQSERHELYGDWLERMKETELVFGCTCTRKSLAAAGGLEVYPGFCRNGLPPGVSPRAWRFKMPMGPDLTWEDRMQGHQSRSRKEVGDVTLLRADGFWAYHLAVVIDDHDQGVTHVVRGADLLESTAAHLALQDALALQVQEYMHLDVVTNESGQKLSKQTLAYPVEIEFAPEVLGKVFDHLELKGIVKASVHDMLSQALVQWKDLYSRNS